MYEVTGIISPNLSSTVQQVGTYTIPAAGKYKIILIGEEGKRENNQSKAGGGGVLVANTYYNANTLLTLRGIQGVVVDTVRYGGAGVALWDTTDATGAPKLAAGGGTSPWGGSGYLGGYSWGSGGLSGYGWDGSRGGNSNESPGGASGGYSSTNSTWIEAGGTGTGSNGYPCPNGYTCTTMSTGINRSTTTYPVITNGNGYASVIYCGPDASSTCP